jgi:hypothetical protein
MAKKRRTNDELIGPNFRDWSEFSTDWSECRTIGPNSNDWSKFRTIGPNSERMTNDKVDVATDVNASYVAKFVKVLNAKKNWRGLT